MSETIGFIGIGRLGLPIATNLLNSGYELRVYNRTASKAQPLVERGAHLASLPVDVVVRGGVVATLVWDDAALESIVRSDGFLEQLGPNGIHIAMSTVLPETSRGLAALHAQHGVAYVEAPIFGGADAAAARQLWIPFTGSEPAKERVRPLLEAMGAQGVFDFGVEAGAANIVKILGNFLIFSAANSLREALSVAESNGVDPKAVVNMLTTTLFAAPIYKSYGQRIAEKTAPFGQSRIPLKDIGLFQQVAQRGEIPTPIAHLMNELLRGGERRGQ